jgi:putative transposase
MARNYYSEINLHVVWHTKESLPLLTPEVEPIVHRHLRHKCVETPGVYVHEIGGTENHVHLCLTVAPTVLVSDLIGQLKGSSSHEANLRVGGRRKVLNWQAGYGVVSFGSKDLEWVRAYVRGQREHHAQGKSHDRLERITDDEDVVEKSTRRPPTRLTKPSESRDTQPKRLRTNGQRAIRRQAISKRGRRTPTPTRGGSSRTRKGR